MLVPLGSLDPRRLNGLCGILVVFLGTPIKLWRFFKGKAFVAILSGLCGVLGDSN